MSSLIHDTEAVSPVVAVLMLVMVVASAAGFIAMMVGDFGADTAELDMKDVGDAAAIKVDIIGTDLAEPATEALDEAYGEINPGVKILMAGDTTDRGVMAVGARMADIAAADRELSSSDLEKYPALEEYQIGNAVIVVISNGQGSFTKDNLRGLYNGSNSTLTAFHYEGETGIEERFCEYINESKINETNENTTTGFDLMLEKVKDTDNSVGIIPFGYVMDESNRKYIAGIEGIKAETITFKNVTEAVRENNESLYPEELRPPIFYVTNGKPSMISDAFINWVRSPRGQEILEKEGYVTLY
ncbi:MAG: substrate-binding domain-containing protein [Candidatus Syntropharchaeales archaeon]